MNIVALFLPRGGPASKQMDGCLMISVLPYFILSIRRAIFMLKQFWIFVDDGFAFLLSVVVHHFVQLIGISDGNMPYAYFQCCVSMDSMFNLLLYNPFQYFHWI